MKNPFVVYDMYTHIYIKVHKGDVFAVKFDEDRIISGSADGKISVLNFNYRR
jgi:hypothetical protein